MQAIFGIDRELQNKLFYKECVNDDGDIHFHSQIELCIVDEGEMEVLINDKKKNLKAGEMALSLSYDAHVYKPVNYSKSTVLVIPLYMCEKFNTTIKNQKLASPFVCNTSVVNEIKGYYEGIKTTWNNPVKQAGYVHLILGTILENVSFEASSPSLEPELASAILMYIHKNYKSDVTLATLSNTFGYTQSYISKHFKASFGIGLNRYLTIIRLKNAILLMHEKKHSITYCALESGFNSMRTFYRIFCDEMHCTPKEYLSKILD